MKYLFYIFLFIGLLSACKTVDVTEVHSKKKAVLTDDKKFEFKYNFFDANKYMLNGDYDMAISLFNMCLSIDSTSSASYYKLASIYLYKKEYALAASFAEKALIYNGDNIWYLYLAGNLYSRTEKYDLAIKTFNKLIQINPDEMDFYLNLADVYLQKKDYKGALKIYNAIEKQFGISEIISMQKHKIYLTLGNFKEALSELNLLANAYPDVIDYKRNIADFYLKVNKIEDAINAYATILKIAPEDGFSYIGLAECYRLKDDVDNSFNALKNAFKIEDVPSDVKVSLLVNIISNLGNDTELKIKAIELTEILIKIYPENPDINTIYANFLLQANDIMGGKKYLERVLEVRKDKYAVWEQLVLIYNQLRDWNTCYSTTKEAISYFPNQSFFYFFNGFSAFQLEKYAESLESFTFGFKLITKSDPLYKDYLTFIGESYHKVGNKAEAYKTFDELLKVDSENIMVLNNYAYYLSVDDVDLKKAEKMSLVTITKEPENATYLDTYAWILFRLKKYEDALVYIQKAVDNNVDKSAVIIEHYGDILFFNGKVDIALEKWLEADSIGEGGPFLKQKIDEKKYIE